MAIYRSDQAQLTFGAEAAPGGHPEIAITGTMAGGVTLRTAHAAGSTSLDVSGDTGFAASNIGDFVCIGGGVSNQEQEIRKIEHIIGTGANTVVYIDAPTAFYHPASTVVQKATPNAGGLVNDEDEDKFINLVPGVYETVDTPDPAQALEGRYFLGTQAKRNFFAAYKGQQSYVGSVPGFVLLDGRAIRYPIGKSVTQPTSITVKSKLSVAANKGDVYISVTSATDLTAGTYVGIDVATSVPVSTDIGEVRKIVDVSGTTLKLDYPLSHTHAAAASGNTQIVLVAGNSEYVHHIFETVDLDTMSWHVHMRDSGETSAYDFDRRYYGGKNGGSSLSADAGGMLTMSWDGVNFMGMVHNQKLGTSTGSSSAVVPFYGLMQKIDQSGTTDVKFPVTEPYYFSEGSVTVFGQELARVRNFSLSIANNEEARYYIQRRYGRQRGPTEIMEQRREYTMAMSIALPDSTAANTATTTRLFNELLWEGDYGSGMQGFNITLRFDRGANDYILITIPDDGASATGGNQQGAFIRTAAHAITGDNPLQVDVDAFFRNMKIEVKDSLYYYP